MYSPPGYRHKTDDIHMPDIDQTDMHTTALSLAEAPPPFKFLPAAPLSRQLYCNASLQTWGGNILEDDDGGFHLYAAGFGTGNCGLSEWLTNSDVIHAVSDKQSANLPLNHHRQWHIIAL